MPILQRNPGLRVGRVLTRRPLATVDGFPSELLTNSLEEFLDGCDLVFEASGDPIHATPIVEQALERGLPVVTMDSEFHVTVGSFFHDKGFLSEAEGDQPGATALLHHEALDMGFEPMAYVNIKGFLNRNPTREDMEYWSEKEKLRLDQVTSFTDGTKLQIEQALTANGLGLEIAKEDLLGPQQPDIYATDELADVARELGQPISDYVVAPGAPPGVFILAEHDIHETLPDYGPYKKLRTREGRAYLLLRPFHLCALEVAKSIAPVVREELPMPLLNNGPVPRVSVAAVAKRSLRPGDFIERGIGSFDVRGSCIRTTDHVDHVPIGLLAGARLRRSVAVDEMITFDDVDLPESRALEIWPLLRQRAVEHLES